MLYLLLFFLAISSGGAVYAAALDRKYEQALPVTCMSIVLTLFLTGLVGCLQAGAAAVLILCILLYPLSLFIAIRRHQLRQALRRMFTPCFFIFAALFLYLYLLNRGRLVYEFDALSHWADVVKAMVQTGTLSTSPLSHSDFQSYPPGMSLFQYFAQRILHYTARPAGVLPAFNEGLLYHAFQVFFISFLFPALRNLSFKKTYSYVLIPVLLLTPAFLFRDVYLYLLVDPFIGMVAASGLAMLLASPTGDRAARVHVLLCIALLPLIKTAGTMFALFLVLAFFVRELLPERSPMAERLKAKWPWLLAAAAALALPWALWQLSVALNHAAVAFGDKVDLRVLVNVLLGRDRSYRKTLRDVFYTAFFEQTSSTYFLGHELSYAVLTCGLFTLLLLLLRLYGRRFPERKGLFKAVFWLCAAELLLYVCGLFVTYLFKFSEYEAMQLASFARYMAIPYQSIWLTAVLLSVEAFSFIAFDRSVAAALLLCAAVTCTSPGTFLSLVNKGAVAESLERRQPYTELFEGSPLAEDTEPKRVYFICQEGNEYNFFIAKFTIRPHVLSYSMGFSFGPGFYRGDLWSVERTAEELREALIGNYDYVLIYDLNDYFYENYASLFAAPDRIRPHSLYRVDSASGLLELCE